MLSALALGRAPAAVAQRAGGGTGAPTVTITPPDTTFTSATTGTITIKWCSAQPFDNTTRVITLNGNTVTSSFSTMDTGTQTGCTYSAQSTGSVTLSQANDGMNTLQGQVQNTGGYLGSKTVTYAYRWPGFVPTRFAVGVWHDDYAFEAQAQSWNTAWLSCGCS